MSLRGRLLLWLAVLVAAAAVALLVPSNGDPAPPREGGPPAAEAATEPVQVERLVARIVAEYPHDPEAYTQGLLWHEGALYESTGLYGRSSVRRVALASGAVERRHALEAMLFGEGLERVGDRLYLLTWRSGTGLVLDLASLEERARFTYEGEGWGLCYDGERLVRSDGSARLAFHAVDGFAPLGEVEVRLGGRPQRGLNELECVDGRIYANVYGADSIVRIDPADGNVDALIDAGDLLDPSTRGAVGVLNGIAYRPETGTFLLTGKNWPRLFEVVLEPRAETAPAGAS